MYEAIIILVISLALYIFIRRLPQLKDNSMKKIKSKKRFEFNWFSIKRKSRAFVRNLIEKIKNIFTKKTTETKFDDSSREKKKKIDVDRSLDKAQKIFEQGDSNTAEKIIIRLIQVKPNEAKLYYFLHKIYLEQNNLKEAALSLREAIKRKEDGFWLMELADIYQKLDKFKLCEKTLQEAIKMNNMIALRWSKLAQIQMKLGKTKEATESINRALEIEPNNQNYKTIRKKITISKN